MKRRNFQERFLIPLNGDPKISFYTKCGTLIATGYDRIVIGGRGPYIEFNTAQIDHSVIFVPQHAKHKLNMSLPYYHEYRTRDSCNVKLYYQKMEVRYADYKVGKWYIDPMLLKTDKLQRLLLPLYEEDNNIVENKNTLFDVV